MENVINFSVVDLQTRVSSSRLSFFMILSAIELNTKQYWYLETQSSASLATSAEIIGCNRVHILVQ